MEYQWVDFAVETAILTVAIAVLHWWSERRPSIYKALKADLAELEKKKGASHVS